MPLTKCKSIGEAVQYILKVEPELRWDDTLEILYTDSYLPPSVPQNKKFPNDSLGSVQNHYMKHYELGENFFPFQIKIAKGISKRDYVACLFNHYHDLIHTLAAYEASDHDEMRLESFLLGQNPLAFARFFQTCFENSEITSPKYKHLRDVWAAPVFWEDHKRGTQTEGLVSFKIEDVLHLPIDSLRKRMKILPRTEFSSPKNTCGIRNEKPFFH